MNAPAASKKTEEERRGGSTVPQEFESLEAYEARLLNRDYNAVLRRRLRENARALEVLLEWGIHCRTIEQFNLGLSAPYTPRKNNEEQADALVYPLRAPSGNFIGKYGYINIPGVTKNPAGEYTWVSGEPRTYYSAAASGKKSVFICGGPVDLWRTWQAVRDAELADALLLIASTTSGAIPKAWVLPSFWSRWELVYLGYESSEINQHVAAMLAEVAGREIRRVLPPERFGGCWLDFWRQGDGAEEFSGLLQNSTTTSFRVQTDEIIHPKYGRFPYQPLNINGAYHNGYLYYTAQVLRREIDVQRNAAGEDVVADVEHLETVVIRSDRTVHTALHVPAPRGTRERDRVLRLSDGTLIDREPQPNKYGTWSWPSIGNYLDGASGARPLGEILRDVSAHLRSSVWLPFDDDYAILSLVVPVTYVQRVFDSVPLLFLNGPPGSGKSETGRAMSRVCANAYVCGQSSAASVARFIDESKGFVVLDDLEVIGEKSGEFGELAQALKLSYNKATAVKLWTDVRTMRTQLLDFYGVKMINNTRGADAILGSRMIRIQTRKIPEGLKAEFTARAPLPDMELTSLRDELHTWAFENVAEVEREYGAMSSKGTDRADEITAPLRAIASLTRDAGLKTQLERALARQQRRQVDLGNPAEVMRESLKRLVVQGYATVSITHLVLEMRDLVAHDHGRPLTPDVAEWACPEWVGRGLRRMGLIDFTSPRAKRARVWGANLRFYPVASKFITEVTEAYSKDGVEVAVGSKSPQEFCRDCESCPYQTLDCEIMKRRKMRRD